MKFFLALVLAVAAVSARPAESEIDWANVVPFWQMKAMEDGTPIKVQTDRRIVNGEQATPHQFPYQTAVLINTATGAGLCGGSVISTTAVLTAAHCTSGQGTGYTIVAGAIDRTVIESQQQRWTGLPLSAFIPHPNYGPVLLRNDVAVVRFVTGTGRNPFTWTNAVQPVILASDNSDRHEGILATVSGFGRFSDSHQLTSPTVLFTRKTIITNTACAARFPGLVVDSTICAQGDNAINNSVCNGDSGGPLTIIRAGASYQVGVVSFGPAAGCETGSPDGYARVSALHAWIVSAAGM
jgi:secreted trypsin-like serine protease